MKYNQPLYLPRNGDIELSILNRNTLEIEYCFQRTTNTSTTPWDMLSGGTFVPPSLTVTIDGVVSPVTSYSFRRRPYYAPYKGGRDLRVGYWLYVVLANNIAEGQKVVVTDPTAKLFTSLFQTRNQLRVTPLIHVNQVGYAPNYQKKAMVSYYLGSAGELDLSYLSSFNLLDANNQVVFTGQLKPRLDVGYEYTPKPYQRVLEADFTSFSVPGVYKVQVPELGVSYAFTIHNEVFLSFARTFALGLLNQRCGFQVTKPYSRHQKNACHSALANIPTPSSSFPETWSMIASETNNTVINDTNLLYPFIKSGKINITGGHHDAGDYSRYCVNSAVFIHLITSGVDNAGLGTLDNLSLPESGNGLSDLLHIAKWEADFVFNMFDDDGGVFHLVYPKTRAYELDAGLQDSNFGDEQAVWIKTTIATAAVAGALAELGSSPLFRQQFGSVIADAYIAQAKKGWTFLMNAIAKYGFTGSFQQVRGGEADHTGALCYAAASLFTATGDTQYSSKLYSWLPDAANVPWQWGWRVMYGFYGCAVRNYAFGVQSGRRVAAEVDPTYLTNCRNQVIHAGENALRDSNNSAHGGSVTYENKNYAGSSFAWFFLSEPACDLVFANAITAKPEYVNAGISNFNNIVGCNPINVSSLSGLGQRRPRVFVSNYQLNDFRTMPPNGQLRASVSAGPTYLEGYKNPDNSNELTSLVFPNEYDLNGKYPPENRYIDQFQVQDEETLCQTHARGIVLSAWLAKLSV